MRSRSARAGTGPAVGVGVLTTVLAVTAAPVAADEQGYYWKWSDGSRAASRVFSQQTWGIPERLPRLVVTAVPAHPSHDVTLQFNYRGTWTTETSARTGADGVATISVDPYCARNTWCRGTFAYRLLVDGQRAPLRLSFSWQ